MASNTGPPLSLLPASCLSRTSRQHATSSLDRHSQGSAPGRSACSSAPSGALHRLCHREARSETAVLRPFPAMGW
ncbi:hypothetical protein [Methanoculleus chikugoensis]|uniref:hypothetical protein n=1 Tax=Methanoculleus chikugoensis TaxID=118126 RepID=UPI001FB2BA97|nr:hypothetical protein [Methanoculleus chikugoensis]